VTAHSGAAERREFQTEAKQILEMMIYSVYSHREIFLRELISNASDALDKRRLEAIRNPEIASEYAPKIRIDRDETNHVLSISDNGIGMTRGEIVDFLGTIARSGTKEFLDRVKEQPGENMAELLIGQFGVGFYSSFMVADRVVLVTRRAGTSETWRFESSGDGTYTIEPSGEPGAFASLPGGTGTTVSLHLKPEDEERGMEDYLAEWKIREIVRKYSDFVSYPIEMTVSSEKNGKAAPEDVVLNSMKAIWTRPESEVSADEYAEFYKHLSHDMNPPLRRIVFSAEGATEFRGLVFVPSKAPVDLLFRERQSGVSLYIRRVFIMSGCEEIVPGYLRFLHGVIDSEDLPLNISREILQNDPKLRIMKRSLVRRVLASLKKLRDEDRDAYRSFWSEFGAVLKEGIVRDPDMKEQILDLCLWKTTKDGGDTTLDEYVSRMAEGQDEIYYLTGRDCETLRSSPHLEAFVAERREVLLLCDPVDDLVMPMTFEYREKKLLPVTREGVVPRRTGARKDDESAAGVRAESLRSLIDAAKTVLSDVVRDVRISEHLTSSPARLVSDPNALSPQMERMFREMGQAVPPTKRILELNAEHPLVAGMNARIASMDDAEKTSLLGLLYNQTLLAEGVVPEKLPDLARGIAMVMEGYLGKTANLGSGENDQIN
jgi:molecular chaperone HtpG